MSENEGEKRMDKDTVEIKIRFNKFWLERAIYIVIILILIVLIFYNPFGKYRCEKGLSEITSEPVVSESETNETSEPIIEEEPEEEASVEEETGTEPDAEPETELSGKITLEIGEITLIENNTKVESISLSIDNQKKIFTPLVYIYWYDKATEEAVKIRPNGGKINYTGAIPIGVKVWKLDNELQNRRLRTDDLDEEIFKIELYDIKDPVAPIDTKTITVPSP